MKSASEERFKKMVDEMVLEATIEDVPGKCTLESLQWVEAEGKKRGLNFYDAVFEILYKHDNKESAKKWLKEKMSN